MPQDLKNSITELVNSLKKNGCKSSASYYLLFSVIIYLLIWDKMNGRASDNRDDVSVFMHNSLNRRYWNNVPMPNVGEITDRLMNEIDRIVDRVQTNADILNVKRHIN